MSRSGLEREVLVADVGAEDRPPGRPRDDVAAHPSLLEAVVGAVFGRRVDPDAVVGDLRRITPSEVRAHVDLAAGEAERGGRRLDVLVVRERVQALDVEEGVVAGELPVAGAEREAAAAPHAAEERIEAARRFEQDFLDLGHEGLGLVRLGRRQLLRLGRFLLGDHLGARRLARTRARRAPRADTRAARRIGAFRAGALDVAEASSAGSARGEGARPAFSTDGATPERHGQTRNSRIFHRNVTGGRAAGDRDDSAMPEGTAKFRMDGAPWRTAPE